MRPAARGRNAVALAAAALLALAGVALLWLGADRRLRGSEPYRLALARLRSAAEVADALGTPLVEPGLASGRFFRAAGLRSARLSIPVAGPRGAARVEAVAHQRAGAWTLDALWLHRDGAAPLALVRERPPDPSP